MGGKLFDAHRFFGGKQGRLERAFDLIWRALDGRVLSRDEVFGCFTHDAT
jgi:hypothetical protein